MTEICHFWEHCCSLVILIKDVANAGGLWAAGMHYQVVSD
jgi:hypothetical protein